jgi:hypothetical protein
MMARYTRSLRRAASSARGLLGAHPGGEVLHARQDPGVVVQPDVAEGERHLNRAAVGRAVLLEAIGVQGRVDPGREIVRLRIAPQIGQPQRAEGVDRVAVQRQRGVVEPGDAPRHRLHQQQRERVDEEQRVDGERFLRG